METKRKKRDVSRERTIASEGSTASDNSLPKVRRDVSADSGSDTQPVLTLRGMPPQDTGGILRPSLRAIVCVGPLQAAIRGEKV